MRLFSIVIALCVAATLYLVVLQRDLLLSLAGMNEETAQAEAPADDTPDETAAPAEAVEAGEEPRRVVSVLAIESEAREVDSAVIIRGRTEAARQVTVRAETSGQVASEPLRKGAFVEAGEWDALALTSFFNARFFSIREEDVRRVGRTDISGPSNTILPIVDCFNHSHAGEPFAVVDEVGPVAVAVTAAPSPSGELFVRYNVYDPLETVLFYGFFDASADWLGSVPFGSPVSIDMVVEIEG